MSLSILVEITLSDDHDHADQVMERCREWHIDGFVLDSEYEPVLMYARGPQHPPTTAIVHGWAATPEVMSTLQAVKTVAQVWKDTIVEPLEPTE